MLLFKKIRNRSFVANDAQLKIVSKLKDFKQRTATCLQQKSELLSSQTKKYCLISFCLFFGGSSVAVIIRSATTKQQRIPITKISRPAHVIPNEKSYLKADSFITKKEYERVEQFKIYLIQLQNDSSFSNRFDSIIQARPHLTDSINLFEKMYLQQK